MIQTVCVDTLGGVKFPEVIAQLPKKYGTGYFWDEFGLAKNQIIRDAQSGRVLIRVQGIWAKHVFGSQHEPKAIQIAKELQKIAVANPKCRIEYSPYCENKKTAAYMLALFKKIKPLCPNVVLINSPVKGGEWVDGYKNEIHHYDKPAGMPKGVYSVSMDGLHQPDCDIEELKRLYPNAQEWYVWAIQDNCKPNAKPENNIPPKTRTCKPTHKLHVSMIIQIENTKPKVELKDGFICKSHSEQHHDVDNRANKLVIVGPKGVDLKSVKVGQYELVDGGFTEDRRNTFRSSKWGMDMGGVVKVIVNGKSVGTVDTRYRQNEYRKKT